MYGTTIITFLVVNLPSKVRNVRKFTIAMVFSIAARVLENDWPQNQAIANKNWRALTNISTCVTLFANGNLANNAQKLKNASKAFGVVMAIASGRIRHATEVHKINSITYSMSTTKMNKVKIKDNNPSILIYKIKIRFSNQFKKRNRLRSKFMRIKNCTMSWLVLLKDTS